MAATRGELADVLIKRGDGVTRNEPARTTVPDGALADLLAIDLNRFDVHAEIIRVLGVHYPTRRFVGPQLHQLLKALIAGRLRG